MKTFSELGLGDHFMCWGDAYMNDPDLQNRSTMITAMKVDYFFAVERQPNGKPGRTFKIRPDDQIVPVTIEERCKCCGQVISK